MKRFLAMLALMAIPAVLVLLSSASSAQAQDRAGSKRPVVTTLSPQQVFGRVQRPVFVVIPRSRPAAEERDLRTGLLREVVRTVQRDPF